MIKRSASIAIKPYGDGSEYNYTVYSEGGRVRLESAGSTFHFDAHDWEDLRAAIEQCLEFSDA